MVNKPLNTLQNNSLSAGKTGPQAIGAKPAKSGGTPEPLPDLKPKKPSSLNKLNEYLKVKFCTEQEVVGVEIQPDSIRLCEAKQEETGWKITKIASCNVLNSYQQESIKKNKGIYSKALKDLFSEQKISNKSIALAIPVSSAIVKTVSLPLMTKENLERATRIPSFWQNLVQISDNIADYSIYYRIVKESPATKEMDVLFIAAKHDDLKTFTEIAKEAGLEPSVIDVGCFSINNLSKLKNATAEEQKPVELDVIMKVGRDENYLQILEHGKPYIYDIFVSDNEKSYLNEYLENPTFQQRFISQLKHIISKHEDKQKVKIEKISVISTEANIDKFLNALNPKMENISVSIIDLFENIKLPEQLLTNEEFQSTKSSYAVCTGLATRNLDIFADENKKNVSETVNLLPNAGDTIKGLKAKFYSKIALWGTIIFCISFVALFGIYSIGKKIAVTKETKEFNEVNKVYKDKQKIFQALSAEGGNLNKLIKIRESIYPNQEILIKGFDEISAQIPEGVWLEEIRIEKEGKLSVTGRAFEERGVITFSKSFDASQTIADVFIASMKSVALANGSSVKEFLILGKLKQDNPPPPAPKVPAAKKTPPPATTKAK